MQQLNQKKKPLFKKTKKQKSKLNKKHQTKDLSDLQTNESSALESQTNKTSTLDSQTNESSALESSTSESQINESQTNESSTSDIIDALINQANNMWRVIKQLIKEKPEFKEWPDKKKLKFFRDELHYGEFMNEFPVMTRYMICMGQYSSKAFKRFLIKVKSVKHPPPDQREKGYMEDQWIRRQADYVQYLWEAYQKSHYNNAERKWVWQEAYKNLKGEFNDFRDKYKTIEVYTKEEKQKLQADNAKDLLLRLTTGKQQLDQTDSKKLVTLLEDRLYRRYYKNTLKELLSKTPYIEASYQNKGKGSSINDSVNKPTIKMIEHTDENRINEIPKEYLLS